MYNECTIMYIHIRSQASDWNCCVKRLFVCAQQSTSLIVHIMIRRIPHKWGAVDYGGCDYGECDYGGCVSVRVWPMG